MAFLISTTLRSIVFALLLILSGLFTSFGVIHDNSVYAATVNVKRDVWSPRILQPKENAIWKVGERVNVTWSIANPPKQITNGNGIIALRTPSGFVSGRGGLGEPLAANFSLFVGHKLVEVPELPARDDYSVVLFGDSGNESPQFKIVTAFMAVAPMGT